MAAETHDNNYCRPYVLFFPCRVAVSALFQIFFCPNMSNLFRSSTATAALGSTRKSTNGGISSTTNNNSNNNNSRNNSSSASGRLVSVPVSDSNGGKTPRSSSHSAELPARVPEQEGANKRRSQIPALFLPKNSAKLLQQANASGTSTATVGGNKRKQTDIGGTLQQKKRSTKKSETNPPLPANDLLALRALIPTSRLSRDRAVSTAKRSDDRASPATNKPAGDRDVKKRKQGERSNSNIRNPAMQENGTNTKGAQLTIKNRRVGRPAQKGARVTTKNLTTAQNWLDQYPGYGLVLHKRVVGKLRCTLCPQDVVANKKSIESHIFSDSHVKQTKQGAHWKSRTKQIRLFVKQQAAEGIRVRGDRREESQLINRIHITQVLLRSGIPISRVDGEDNDLCYLLERGANCKISISHFRQLIPTVRDLEVDAIRQELSQLQSLSQGRPFISIIFDGSTKVEEAYVILFRWVEPTNMRIHQRLVAVELLDKSVNGAELGALILVTVLHKYHVDPKMVAAVICDGAPVNRTAYEMCLPSFSLASNILCHAHAANLVGNKATAQLSLAKEFFNHWNSLTESLFAKKVWLSQKPRRPKRKSRVRWGSEYSVALDVLHNFNAVLHVIGTQEFTFCEKIRPLLRDMI
jgi:hypothetical protein